MKKVFALFLILVLALCACGQSSTDENVTSSSLETVQPESIPQENTPASEETSLPEESIVPETQMETPEETPAPVVVSLTLDNWSEYLEFSSRYDASVNGFGEVDSVTYWFDICLKEEYLPTLDTQNSAVTVEISFARGTQYGTFSKDRKEFTADGEYDKWEGAEKTEVYDLSTGGSGFGACYTLASSDFDNNSFGPFYPSEQTVLRITGTLVFK